MVHDMSDDWERQQLYSPENHFANPQVRAPNCAPPTAALSGIWNVVRQIRA